MKVKIGGKVFVQNFDIKFILDHYKEYPTEINDKIFANNTPFSITSEQSKYCFRYCFEDPETTAWFDEQGWLLDYNFWSQKTKSETKTAIKYHKRATSTLIKKLSKEKPANRNLDAFLLDLDIENHFIESFKALLRNGKNQLFIAPSAQ